MSMFTNVVVLYMCFAVSLFAFGVATPFTELVDGTEGTNNVIDALIAGFGNPAALIVLLGAAFAGLIIGGGFAIPTFLIVIAASMLIDLFTFPVGLLNSTGVPDEVRLILFAFVALLQFMFAWGLALMVSQRD